jgi:hypothetical protein
VKGNEKDEEEEEERKGSLFFSPASTSVVSSFFSRHISQPEATLSTRKCQDISIKQLIAAFKRNSTLLPSRDLQYTMIILTNNCLIIN